LKKCRNGKQNHAGETPHHTAVLQVNLAAVRLLLKAGANATTAVRNLGMNALYLAADKGNLPIVESIINYGADINSSSQGLG
jgi:ankyrin repeat protein